MIYRYSLFDKIRVVIWSFKNKKYEKKIVILDTYKNSILGIKELYKKPEYLKISNIVFMDLSLNHIKNINMKQDCYSEWINYAEIDKIVDSVVTITYISQIHILRKMIFYVMEILL